MHWSLTIASMRPNMCQNMTFLYHCTHQGYNAANYNNNYQRFLKKLTSAYEYRYRPRCVVGYFNFTTPMLGVKWLSDAPSDCVEQRQRPRGLNLSTQLHDVATPSIQRACAFIDRPRVMSLSGWGPEPRFYSTTSCMSQLCAINL